ncbi:MAG: TIM barrel protein [Streptosporangiales bacterium]|nr:TIM barrel protein [Streptosporangiales bacterium]
MRFAVNVSMLFVDLPMNRRPEAAKQAGFDAVEMWWPFTTPEPADAEVDALLSSIDDAGVELTGLNFDAGDMPAGDRGLVSLPDQQARFRANVPVAVDIAKRTGCRVINALYGNRQEDVAPWRQDECALANLAWAADAAHGVATVVLEPLNSYENPRYPVLHTTHGLDVIRQVQATGGTSIGLLYDAYHMQRMEGNLIDTISRHGAEFAHIQLADSPGRSTPGTGEIAFGRVLDALQDTGYSGMVGLEYRSTTPDPFGWLSPSARSGELDTRPSDLVTA